MIQYDRLQILHEMTRTIGQPHMRYVIIGEGNTSCRIPDAPEPAFYIKASGQMMENIAPEGFTAVRFAPILAMLEQSPGNLDAQKAVMDAAKLDPAMRTPSTEVTFHAMLLTECADYGVQFIGHTHPIAVNQLMCSSRAEQFAATRRFPDEIVLCGPKSAFVPYCDPGLPLAVEMRNRVREYIREERDAPKVILLQNHGLIALGSTPKEVLNITAMAVKAAEIFAGACMVGEPTFMTEDDIRHIYRRPDEIYRREGFVAD